MRFDRSLVILTLLFASSCGRYLPPIPPESLAPQSVEYISSVGDDTGILFTWKAPGSDVRGKKLKEIDGYKILRVDISTVVDLTDEMNDLDFSEVGYVEDTHLEELKKLQDEAEEKGQIVRKVKIDAIKETFTFKDVGLTDGATYLYKIVPIYRGSVEGEAKNLYRVKYSKTGSVVDTLPNRGKNVNILQL